MVKKRDVTLSGFQAFELLSDAATNELAIQEMDRWCRLNDCTRSGELHLETKMSAGQTMRVSIAYPASATVNQGKEIYTSRIASRIGSDNVGKYLAIDVETGDYVVSDDEFSAFDQLKAIHSSARVYLMRIGYAALTGVGAVVRREGAV